MDTDAEPVIRVWDKKGDEFRETPAPSGLVAAVETQAEIRDDDPDKPILSESLTRSLRRWVNETCGELAGGTGDRGWQEVSTYDLRRAWATTLADAEVGPLLALDGV